MIVALSGVKFSGKDTVAEGLIRSHGFRRIGLADKLKDLASDIFGIPREDMDNPSKKEEIFEFPITIKESHLLSLVNKLSEDGFDFNLNDKLEFFRNNFIDKNLTSIRDLLQVLGTDICRTHIKDDIWLQYVKKRLTEDEGNLVITDARFENERLFLRELGAVLILVKRPGYENKSTHISENQLGNEDDYDVLVLNDSTISAVQSDIAMWYTVMKDAIKSNRKR